MTLGDRPCIALETSRHFVHILRRTAFDQFRVTRQIGNHDGGLTPLAFRQNLRSIASAIAAAIAVSGRVTTLVGTVFGRVRQQFVQLVESRGESCHVGWSVVGMFGDGVSDESREGVWNLRPDRVQGHRLGESNRFTHGVVVGLLEGPPAGEHLIEHDTERPDIRTCIDIIAAKTFGAHVRQRADDGAGPRQSVSRQLGDAEVEDLDDALGRQHHVGRLDVTMNDAALVCMRESLGDLPGDADGLVQRHPTSHQAIGQRLAGIERHGDKKLPVARLADLMNGADVPVIERRGGACFEQES
jgi:hypothetical protein